MGEVATAIADFGFAVVVEVEASKASEEAASSDARANCERSHSRHGVDFSPSAASAAVEGPSPSLAWAARGAWEALS